MGVYTIWRKVESLGGTWMLVNSLSQKKTTWEMWLCVKNCFKPCLSIKKKQNGATTGNKVNVSCSSSATCPWTDLWLCPFKNPRLGQGGCQQLERGGWQAAHPFKEAQEEKGAFFRDKEEGGEKLGAWQSILACPSPGVMRPHPGRSQHPHSSPSLSARTPHAWI